MKAITLSKYGPPENLQIQDIEKPSPGPDEILVKIHFSAINDYVWSMVTGDPKLYRLLFGLTKPKNQIPGMEFSGTVTEVGSNIKKFKSGDNVYGDTSEHSFGTFTEYACFPANVMQLKPDELSFEEVVTIPHAACLAMQGLIDKGQIKKGDRVLINGAGGGVGMLGLQIAKQYEVEVTGVDTGEKLKMMESVGFDQIIDYTQQDFTTSGEKYDLILDAKTNRSPGDYIRSLNSGGRYVTVGGSSGKLFRLLLRKAFTSDGKKLEIVALNPNQNLEVIHNMFLEGKIKTVIDGPYPLEDYPSRLRYFGEGKHTGKVVISLLN